MQRKTAWLMIISVFILAVVFSGSSYYWHSSKNQESLSNQLQGEKEFLDFLAQKKKLLQTNEEVFLVANKIAYFWNNNDFEKSSTTTVYKENYNIGSIISKSETADLDNNSIQEIYSLENGRIAISENSKIVWESPNNWWIDNFILADSNNNGVVDINLSLWKTGNFGPSKPFWVKKNDMSVKNHFFIFDFVSGAIKSIWGSSNLGMPNCEFKFADVDGDKKNDLIVIEGDYSQKPKCKGNYVAVWKWNDWGFSNEWRSEKGNFSNLEIEKIGTKNYIVVNSF